MPLYSFNVYESRNRLDTSGMELPDLNAARRVTLQYASEIMREQAHGTIQGESWHMELANATGSVLMRVDVRVTRPLIANEADPCEGAVERS